MFVPTLTYLCKLIWPCLYISVFAPYTDPIPTLCPGAPPGFDHYRFGRAYRSFLDLNQNFDSAQANCKSAGGALPVLASAEDYLGIRAMASKQSSNKGISTKDG